MDFPPGAHGHLRCYRISSCASRATSRPVRSRLDARAVRRATRHLGQAINTNSRKVATVLDPELSEGTVDPREPWNARQAQVATGKEMPGHNNPNQVSCSLLQRDSLWKHLPYPSLNCDKFLWALAGFPLILAPSVRSRDLA